MSTKIKHLAIVSENYAIEEKFYQAVFGMKTAERARIESAAVVSDGYVGININPRRPGRQGGFDHFGFEVDDVEGVSARMAEKYPEVQILKRPSNRPFAGLSTHDPAGNVFDLSQEGMENRSDVYVDGDRQADRHVKHFVLRAVEPGAGRRVLSGRLRPDGNGETRRRSQCLPDRRPGHPDHRALEDLRLRRHRHRTSGAGPHWLQRWRACRRSRTGSKSCPSEIPT